MRRKIPVTRDFDNQQVIGMLMLQDGVDIPLDSVFSLGYIIEERASDGTPTKGHIQSVSLISDSNFLQYLKSKETKDE